MKQMVSDFRLEEVLPSRRIYRRNDFIDAVEKYLQSEYRFVYLGNIRTMNNIVGKVVDIDISELNYVFVTWELNDKLPMAYVLKEIDPNSIELRISCLGILTKDETNSIYNVSNLSIDSVFLENKRNEIMAS
jgi:hypothetical protein